MTTGRQTIFYGKKVVATLHIEKHGHNNKNRIEDTSLAKSVKILNDRVKVQMKQDQLINWKQINIHG